MACGRDGHGAGQECGRDGRGPSLSSGRSLTPGRGWNTIGLTVLSPRRLRSSVLLLRSFILIPSLASLTTSRHGGPTEALSPARSGRRSRFPPASRLSSSRASRTSRSRCRWPSTPRAGSGSPTSHEYPFAAAGRQGTRQLFMILDGLRPRRQGAQDHDLRRRPQHPDRHPAAARLQERASSTSIRRTSRMLHRHRRRRQGGQDARCSTPASARATRTAWSTRSR